jgi:hypothetical protein
MKSLLLPKKLLARIFFAEQIVVWQDAKVSGQGQIA